MKALFYSLLASAVLLAGCAKDNVDPPSSNLTGRITYQDQVLGLRSNGSTNLGSTPTMLELWQRGYQLFTKIPVYVNQDGTFSATLFDGNYKLVRTRGNGPWVDNTDTVEVQVRGNTTVDVPVQPYFVVTNGTFQKNGGALTATCQVSKVAPTAVMDRVVLFVGTTQFVDNTNSVARTELTGTAVADLSKALNFSLTLPTTLRSPFYARIGVKATNSGEYLYTPVQKIEF